MATIVDHMPAPRSRYSANALYPWDAWLDGRSWRLELGTDFTGDPRRLVNNARIAARRRGLRLRTTMQPDGYLYIEAVRSNS
ncbi:MAG TPA: hypothetical protein VF244_10485 [Acidimicrobiales bacterium]